MVQAQGIMFVPPPTGIFFVAIGGLLQSLPYLADRLLAPRLPGFAATLVFPLALTALSFGDSATNPTGNWGAWAYTQYGNLALVQLVSITGMHGLTFLIGWFGPVVNWAWDRPLERREIWRGVVLYVGVLVLVLAFGMVRLAFFPWSPVR
jgi:apolipoprotein N-acyltransferase